MSKPTNPPAGQTWRDGEWVLHEESPDIETSWVTDGWAWRRYKVPIQGCMIFVVLGGAGMVGLIGGVISMFV